MLFNVASAQAGSLADQSPETGAMHEIKFDETLAAEEMGGNIQGIVVGANPALGVLSVRDDEEDDQLYTISVKRSTTYSGIASLTDIEPGDSISVDCYSLNGHLVAENIVLEDRASPAQQEVPLQKVLED